jgi:hypothetical protein
MGYESTAEPIKIGYLMDFLLPEGFPQTYFEDLTQPFEGCLAGPVRRGATRSGRNSSTSTTRPTAGDRNGLCR